MAGMGACCVIHSRMTRTSASLMTFLYRRCATEKSAEFEGVSTAFHTLARRKRVAREIVRATKEADSGALRSLFEKFRDDAILSLDG